MTRSIIPERDRFGFPAESYLKIGIFADLVEQEIEDRV